MLQHELKSLNEGESELCNNQLFEHKTKKETIFFRILHLKTMSPKLSDDSTPCPGRAMTGEQTVTKVSDALFEHNSNDPPAAAKLAPIETKREKKEGHMNENEKEMTSKKEGDRKEVVLEVDPEVDPAAPPPIEEKVSVDCRELWGCVNLPVELRPLFYPDLFPTESIDGALLPEVASVFPPVVPRVLPHDMTGKPSPFLTPRVPNMTEKASSVGTPLGGESGVLPTPVAASYHRNFVS